MGDSMRLEYELRCLEIGIWHSTRQWKFVEDDMERFDVVREQPVHDPPSTTS